MGPRKGLLFLESHGILPNSIYRDSLRNRNFEIKINTWVWILVLSPPSFAMLNELFSCAVAALSLMRMIMPASQPALPGLLCSRPRESLALGELPVPVSFRADSVEGWAIRGRRRLSDKTREVTAKRMHSPCDALLAGVGSFWQEM